ncbi:putative trafficking protein particle complex subunit 11 [Helianthus annuus]|uniref:Trafficking protein particle complex subunit 11 n=1 Tax=Helianthus annuus TaxID=4232 RepID=A0A251TW16_HELAN|nr:trafficking protein particle complex subunit 11 [Helianthus annuus]KAF5791128.1 putative trafficking protein particle complex subunit 11 [Helianthus annuus]
MEHYPEELRTPPVTLACIIGHQDLHATISTHLHSEQPPINTLALPDFSKISVIDRTPKDKEDQLPSAYTSTGIIKRDWLLKHRTRVPAVVAALFDVDQLSGDPVQWQQVCTDLENLKAVIRGRNIKLVVVVVVRFNSKESITEERMVALRKRAEVDAKYVVTFIPDDASELNLSLNRLGNIFGELAVTFYRDEGRKVKTRLEKKSYGSIEFNVRYCFKVAIYAEFRRDWAEALRMYEDGYHALREMIGTSTRLPAIQRLVEIKMVAEQFHFKISTLLLHGGKVLEAIKWFRQHNASYKNLTGPTQVNFLHWEWLSRQFLVFAELLETTSATISSPALTVADRTSSDWEFRPAYYYQLAAQFLKEKKKCVESAVSTAPTETDESCDSIVPSLYVGQFARLLDLGETSVMQLITDDDYVLFALTAERKKLGDSTEIIALLKNAYEAYNNSKSQRTASFCMLLMAKEYFLTSDYTNSKLHFDKLTSLYRQEGWVTLLWEVLGYLRECSRKLGSAQDFISYSLEMAALPISSISGLQELKDCGPGGSPSLKQVENIHKEVFAIVREEICNEEEIMGGMKVNGDHPLHLEIDLVSPLRVALLTSVAFHEQIVKPHAPTLITLSLLSQLPSPVEIDQLEIQFNQTECNFIIVNAQRRESSSLSNIHPDRRVETVPVIQLSTNKWLRLTYDIKSVNSGKLECTYVIARIGPHFSICCGAESPANMNDLPLWKFEERFEASPTKDPAIAFSGMKVTQVEEPDPQVDLKLGAAGPALVGENFLLPVTLTSKGHSVESGELKINLVDTRGVGLLSPREAEHSSSSDNLHVELLGVSCGPTQDNNDNIRKIQQSFGLVSVPFLNVGDSWSCNLEIQWHHPKPIMLYVSLGYSPSSGAPKVHIHKSLQIEGKTPVVISHRLMLPFRRDPLLLSRLKRSPESGQTASLPVNETSILVVNATNCTEVPLRLLSMSISEDDVTSINKSKTTCMIQSGIDNDPTLLVPGEEFKKVFTVKPELNVSKLHLGSVCLRWRRDHESSKEVVTKQSLPDVNLEFPPLIITLECPPHGVLGEPFTYFARIRNQTKLLQEVKFSLSDSQSFVLSGPHNDTTFVLPLSEYILSYKLVPLSSGSLQLPRVTITSVRYSAGFQPTTAASTIFIFPSKPQFQLSEPEKKSNSADQVPQQIPA